MAQDSLRESGVGDASHDFHADSAVRAGYRVHAPHAGKQGCPGDAEGYAAIAEGRGLFVCGCSAVSPRAPMAIAAGAL